MSIQDNLFTASFRGVSFLVEGGDTSAGKKVVPHEYPKQSHDYDEDLGNKQRSFEVRAVVTGENYFARRTALIAALRAPEAGLLVHPFYGLVLVIVKEYSLSEDITTLGECRISISFKETGPNIFPIDVGIGASGVGELVNTALSLLAGELATKIYVDDKRNVNPIAQKLTDLGGLLGTTLPTPALVDKTNKDIFAENLKQYNASVYSMAQNTSELSVKTSGILSDFNNIFEDAEYAYNATKRIFSYGNNDTKLSVDTVYLETREQNNIILNGSVRATAFCNLLFWAVKIEYSDNEKLNIVKQYLIETYENILFNSDLDRNTEIALANVFYAAKNFLLTLNIGQIENISIAPTPITALLYNYYGNFDYEEEIASINNIANVSNISGDIKILRLDL